MVLVNSSKRRGVSSFRSTYSTATVILLMSYFDELSQGMPHLSKKQHLTRIRFRANCALPQTRDALQVARQFPSLPAI
jgi:hypothetical protein